MIEQRENRVLLSNVDIETYGIDAEILGGVSWSNDCERFYPESVFAELSGRVPDWIFRKAMSTYWGIFAQNLPIYREIWKDGKIQKVIKMYNRNKNIFWAQTLISRVCRHVYEEAAKDARQVYVDSVLVPRKIETGLEIGQWKLVNEFPLGIMIKNPGVWTAYPDGRKLEYNYWHKHAGYSDIQ